ncbi:MAG: radical SAM protein [Clostridiales bacterium]|nr:radical SAM protein [Clostridiales bacterium]
MEKSSTEKLAKRITLVVTHQCNFDCRYCLQKHEDVSMTKETAIKSIDAFASGIVEGDKAQISFYGGEPLLQKELIKELVNYSCEKILSIPDTRLTFEITTNGLLLDEDFIAFAKRNKILLALSHDGLAQDEVRTDRGGNKTKDRIDEKLQMLLKTFPETIVMMTVHPDYVDRIVDSLKFFRSKGVKSVSMVLAHGERVSWDDETFEKLTREMNKVEALYEQWNAGNDVFRFIPFDNKIKNYIRQRDADSVTCHFGCHKFMVDADGKYYPCSHFIGRDGFGIGSLEEGISEEKLKDLESKRVEPEDCKGCALRFRCRHTCACSNHGHTGSMSEVSALQCEYEKLTIQLADRAAALLLNESNPGFVSRMYPI